MAAIRIAIAGSTGRMGRMLIETVLDSEGMALAAALEHPRNPHLGEDAAEFRGKPCGIIIGADVAAALTNTDVLIDFTRPEGTLAHLAACRAAGVHMVIGTTGFDAAGKTAIQDTARDVGVVFAPNMSVGINVLFKLVATAARALETGYDIEIIESHHRHKIDAPSGTALALGEAAAAATGRELAQCAIYDRHDLNAERSAASIGFSSIRGGDMVGDHTVLFAGTGERIEITHRASSRATYATGAMRAARFVMQHGRGLYDMQHVLGLA